MKSAVFLLALFLAAGAVSAQQQLQRYEQLYGTPVDVTIADIVNGGLYYANKAIRTHGRLERVGPGGGGEIQAWVLRDSFAYKILIMPVAEISGEFNSEAHFRSGQELRITGVVQDLGGAQPVSGIDVQFGVQFWKFDVPPDPSQERLSKAKGIPMRQLLQEPRRWAGATIRVAGAFRGSNLYGDLPGRTQRNRKDWVLADDDQAIWVTGKKPKGQGWELDPAMKRDTGKWIEVAGVPELRDGTVYLRAISLALVPAPDRPAVAAPLPTPPPPPKAPPIVVFALPLDGETEVPGDTRFIVQFSKDMDEATFKDRVRLDYYGPPVAGVRPLDSVTLSYDRGRRALTVDPGDQLRRGAVLELKLLPGIKDVDGLELVPRKGKPTEELADILRFKVG
jgi:hypothetical protein